MEPIRIPTGEFQSNLNYQLPGGTEENDLPCQRSVTETGEGPVTVIRSVWILDGEDIDTIIKDPANARIVLTIVGEPIPPVGLSVEAIPIIEPEENGGTSGPGFPE